MKYNTMIKRQASVNLRHELRKLSHCLWMQMQTTMTTPKHQNH